MDLLCHRIVHLLLLDTIVVQEKLHCGESQEMRPLLLILSYIFILPCGHQLDSSV